MTDDTRRLRDSEARQVPPCIHSHERWKLASTRFAHARISILRCEYCGWIDTEAAIEEALALEAAAVTPPTSNLTITELEQLEARVEPSVPCVETVGSIAENGQGEQSPPAPEVNLHATMDGMVWAKEFCRITGFKDLDWALSWFCNAIMVGWDFAHRASASAAVTPEGRKALCSACNGNGVIPVLKGFQHVGQMSCRVCDGSGWGAEGRQTPELSDEDLSDQREPEY